MFLFFTIFISFLNYKIKFTKYEIKVKHPDASDFKNKIEIFVENDLHNKEFQQISLEIEQTDDVVFSLIENGTEIFNFREAISFDFIEKTLRTFFGLNSSYLSKNFPTDIQSNLAFLINENCYSEAVPLVLQILSNESITDFDIKYFENPLFDSKCLLLYRKREDITIPLNMTSESIKASLNYYKINVSFMEMKNDKYSHHFVLMKNKGKVTNEDFIDMAYLSVAFPSINFVIPTEETINDIIKMTNIKTLSKSNDYSNLLIDTHYNTFVELNKENIENFYKQRMYIMHELRYMRADTVKEMVLNISARQSFIETKNMIKDSILREICWKQLSSPNSYKIGHIHFHNTNSFNELKHINNETLIFFFEDCSELSIELKKEFINVAESFYQANLNYDFHIFHSTFNSLSVGLTKFEGLKSYSPSCYPVIPNQPFICIKFNNKFATLENIDQIKKLSDIIQNPNNYNDLYKEFNFKNTFYNYWGEMIDKNDKFAAFFLNSDLFDKKYTFKYY